MLELDDKMIGIMKELVFELLCQGDLTLARVLRMKLIEKVEAKKTQEVHHQEHNTPLSSISVTTK